MNKQRQGVSRRIRRRKNPASITSTRFLVSCWAVGTALCLLIYWYSVLSKAQALVDTNLNGKTLLDDMRRLGASSPPLPPTRTPVLQEALAKLDENRETITLKDVGLKILTNYTRYIVFEKVARAQGQGNSINGLLGAHLLGLEYNRLVCVSTEYEEFLAAFRPIIPQAIQECPNLPPKQGKRKGKSISLFNFQDSQIECEMQTALSSNETIVWFTGNTYPRWRSVPDCFFSSFYEPTKALIAILPWQEAPALVVHLRHGDHVGDVRKGLDFETLTYLGEELPRETFLVTNWLAWYDFFEKYGWHHPNWISIKHSAMRGITWADRVQRANVTEEERNLQLWSDWYTILSAKYVVHTHSDFSLSAIHWMNVRSHTVDGIDEGGHLVLLEEPWRRQGTQKPFSLRTGDELKCDNMSAEKYTEKARGQRIQLPDYLTKRRDQRRRSATSHLLLQAANENEEADSREERPERRRTIQHNFPARSKA